MEPSFARTVYSKSTAESRRTEYQAAPQGKVASPEAKDTGKPDIRPLHWLFIWINPVFDRFMTSLAVNHLICRNVFFNNLYPNSFKCCSEITFSPLALPTTVIPFSSPAPASSVQSADVICCLSICTVPRHPTASYLPAGTATGAYEGEQRGTPAW